jgi:hypothetical protein
MPLTFPSSPSNGETYAVGSRTWTWNGSIWEINGTAAGVASVGETELTANAVTTAKIADGAITTAKIANSSVTVAKIESNPTFTGTVTLPANTSIGNVSSTEISYVDGVTSTIQTQLNTKAPIASPTFTGTVALPTTTASGVLTATAQPRFLATRSGNLTGYTGGTVVVFNATTYNIGSHFNTSTGLFTAPVSGNYVFSASIYQSRGVVQIWFIINGSRERTFAFDGSSSWAILAGSSYVYLTAGDTLGITSWSDQASGVTIFQQYEHTFLRGALIS